MSPTVRIVIQARMGSARRPGKTVADVAGKPLLARCCERLNAAVALGRLRLPRFRWELVVATSRLEADDRIAQLAAELGIGCVRGPEDDVLRRYLVATADLRSTDVVVRATADNPLYCPERTVDLVAAHFAGGHAYTGIAEALSPVVPEAMRVAALRGIVLEADLDDYCREHVTPYLRRGSRGYPTQMLPPDWRSLDPGLRLTVDTPADLAAMNKLYRALISLTGDDRAAQWSWEQIYGVATGLQASCAADATNTKAGADVSIVCGT